jgi:hypothetical protein
VTDVVRARAPRRQRSAMAVATLACGVVVLAGCDGGSPGGRDVAASSAAEGSAAPTSAPALADGLLPPEAFGAQARVVGVTLEQLQQGAGLAARAKDLTVTPPECTAAVRGTQPDVAAFDDVAAESATLAGSTTVEVLLRGGPTGGSLDAIDQAVARCPRAQVTSPQFGTATITFRSLPVDDLGDGAAALQFTTVVTQPGGARISVPALVGVVQDGDRLVTLLTLKQSGAPPDATAFTDLLKQAYQGQAEALD